MKMFKFVDGVIPPQKRQQSSRACEPCRKRKKRCHHSTTIQTPQRATQSPNQDDLSTSQDLSPSTAATDYRQVAAINAQTSPESQAITEPVEVFTTHDRLLSPMQPHENAANSLDLEKRDELPQARNSMARGGSVQSTQDPQPLNSRFIGDLNPEGVFLAATSPETTRGDSVHDSVGVWLTTALNRRASHAEFPVTAQSPSALFQGTSTLIQKVLMPMLQEECLSALPSPPRCDALSKIYFESIHPIFPVVDEDTYRSLKLSEPARVLLLQSICLAASKNPAARQHLVLADSSEVLRCREFGDKLSGAMRLSIEMDFVSDRIVLIQVLALMSQFTDAPDGGDLSSQFCSRAIHHVQSIGLHCKPQQNDATDQYGNTLLSCIWAIDRTNAAFNGRPVLMHERDLRKDFERCFEQQVPCFRLLLHIVKLLDTVIALYRPSTSQHDLSLVEDFPSFEDVVVRCEATNIGTSSLATIETLYHAVAILSCRSKSWRDPERSSNSYLRQSLSIASLSSVAGREFHDQWILFPFVPYALSLSLSIVYREMRHSKIPLHRVRARTHFQRICDALGELEGAFWRANNTAEMGRKMLKEMDRAFSLVAASENRRLPLIAPDHTATTEDFHNEVSNLQFQNWEDPTVISHDVQVLDPMQGFDPSILDFIGDVDLFDMFDPSFDLDGFDSCLEGSVNPCFPTQFH